jgi:hypothetical protein
MRRRAHSIGKQAALLTVVLGIAAACASSVNEDSAASSFEPHGTGGGGTSLFDANHSSPDAPSGHLNPLCGIRIDCATNPDDPLACKSFHGGHPNDSGVGGRAGASAGGASAFGGRPATGGRSGSNSGAVEAGPADGSDASEPVHDAGSPADAIADRSESDRSVSDSGVVVSDGSGVPGDLDGSSHTSADAGPAFSCQVAVPPSGTGGSTAVEPFHRCLPAGTGKSGSGCSSSAECRPGLACVGLEKASVGWCYPYCCDPTTSCEQAWLQGGGADHDSGTNLYCGERTLIDAVHGSTIKVPVCVPADRCTLGQPYPCTGSSCFCPQGTACTVTVIHGDGGDAVRGTTVCAPVGSGRSGERCPCAAGYFCSVSTALCSKICRTDVPDAGCSPGRCQGAAGFPDKWGICVGPPPAAK